MRSHTLSLSFFAALKSMKHLRHEGMLMRDRPEFTAHGGLLVLTSYWSGYH